MEPEGWFRRRHAPEGARKLARGGAAGCWLVWLPIGVRSSPCHCPRELLSACDRFLAPLLCILRALLGSMRPRRTRPIGIAPRALPILLAILDPRAQAHTNGKRRSVRMWDLVIFVHVHAHPVPMW